MAGLQVGRPVGVLLPWGVIAVAVPWPMGTQPPLATQASTIFYVGLKKNSMSCNPGKCKELTMHKNGFVEELCKIHNIPQCSKLKLSGVIFQ